MTFIALLWAFALPLMLVTLALAAQGRRRFLQDLDDMLHNMDFEAVHQRVVLAQRHTVLFGAHTAIMLGFFLITIGSSRYSLLRILWLYAVLIHALALYLYYQRWNPATLARKRKIDQDHVQASGAAFDPDAIYTVGADGELQRLSDQLQAARAERRYRLNAAGDLIPRDDDAQQGLGT